MEIWHACMLLPEQCAVNCCGSDFSIAWGSGMHACMLLPEQCAVNCRGYDYMHIIISSVQCAVNCREFDLVVYHLMLDHMYH